MILVDSVAHEQNRKPLRERLRRCRARAKQGSDSSHGKAMVTPAPRRTVRREMESADFFVDLACYSPFLLLGGFWRIWSSFIQELRTGDDGLHQRAKR